MPEISLYPTHGTRNIRLSRAIIYSSTMPERLTALIADARLAVYVNPEKPLLTSRIYQWHTELSAAWHQTLSHVEIIIRNSMDVALAEWNSALPPRGRPRTRDWLATPGSDLATLVMPKRDRNGRVIGRDLSREVHAKARRARENRDSDHPRKNAELSHDDLVSQLTFGDLLHLLPQGRVLRGVHGPLPAPPRSNQKPWACRERLWIDALQHAFVNSTDVFPESSPEDPIRLGYTISEYADNLRRLRNRVSHYEHIVWANHARRHDEAEALIAAIDRDAGHALRELSGLRDVLERDPGAPTRPDVKRVAPNG